jgi:hypothetical protein
MEVTLKSGWHEVTLAEFGTYERDIAPLFADAANALAWLDGIIALAKWVSDAPTEWLEADVKRPAAIIEDCRWVHTLPAEGTEPVPLFTHEGRTYHHAGNLDTINAGQMQALLATVEDHGADVAALWPRLLAVLYKEAGAAQTVDTYEATAAALGSLPVTVGWPALAFFLRSSAPLALASQQSSSAQTEAERLEAAIHAAVTALESDLAAPIQARGLRGFFLRWRRSAVARWLKSVKRTLANC